MLSAILFVLFLLCVVIGAAIFMVKATIQMIRILKNPEKYQKHQNTQTEWKSEWKWDEESQTWVHPRSRKTNTHTESEYTISQEEIDRINKRYQTNTVSEPEIKIDFAHAYQAQPLFTRNEWQNYKTLREVAEVKGYVICPKVRLLDIVRPRNGEQKYKTLLYKIQSKHVDFVICDQNMTIKAIIELDDSTHDTQKGKERDEIVDTVLRSVGYKVIHTRYINHDILDLI